jgi:hypothetical protein
MRSSSARPEPIDAPPAAIGRRILIYGPAAAGKSTVARRLGAALDIPVIHLDDLLWLPGWQRRPFGDFVAAALDAVRDAGDAWICDGHVGLRRTLVPLADTAVWLDLPFRHTYPRLLRRSFHRARTNAVVAGGNRATWRSAFGPHSLPVAAVRFEFGRRRKSNRALAGVLADHPGVSVHRLTSGRAVNAFLAGLPATPATSNP